MGSHGWFKFWVLSGTTFLEIPDVRIDHFGADIKYAGTLDIMAISPSQTVANALTKNALIRVTDTNTTDGKNPTTGTIFFYQDYVIREPVFPRMDTVRGYVIHAIQEGISHQDTLLEGPYESPSQAAYLTFKKFVEDAGATVGVYDTTGNAATVLKYSYENDTLYDKLRSLAEATGCFVHFRRGRVDPSLRYIDFLDPNSAVAIRPDGTTGWKTTSPFGTPNDPDRIIYTFSDVDEFTEYDEVEAQESTIKVIGSGTGAAQASGKATGAGRGTYYHDPAIRDAASAAAVASARQSISPQPRATFELIKPVLWTGTFKAIIGDQIAVKDETAVLIPHAGNYFQGQFTMWEYQGDRDIIQVHLNRSRYYDDEATKTKLRYLETLHGHNQGSQNWNSIPGGSNAGSGRPLYLSANIPAEARKHLSAQVEVALASTKSDYSVAGGGGGGDVTGLSGTGVAAVSEQLRAGQGSATLFGNPGGTPNLNFTFRLAGIHVQYVYPTTLHGSPKLPAAPFGYLFIFEFWRYAEDTYTTEVDIPDAYQSYVLTVYLDNGSGTLEYLGDISIPALIRQGQRFFFQWPWNRENYELVVQVNGMNVDISTYNRLKCYLFKFSDHKHDAADSGHGDHADGTYSTPAGSPSTIATSLSGGSATTGTVEIAIRKAGGAWEVVAAAQSVPSNGVAVDIPIGTASGQIPEGFTGLLEVRITPTTDVFVGGQVTFQDKLEV